jgi:hypothetical protein
MLRDDVKYYSLSPSILTLLLDIGGVPEAPLKLENFHQKLYPWCAPEISNHPLPPKIVAYSWYAPEISTLLPPDIAAYPWCPPLKLVPHPFRYCILSLLRP